VQKKKVLFVGSFLEKAKDGSVGGQMYACRSLLSSSLSDNISWVLLDTTGISVPPPPLFTRCFFAFLRIFKYLYLIFIKSPSSVLIFSASGASFFEKGFMIILGKLFNKKTIFAPRGGPLIQEINNNYFTKIFFKYVVKSSDYVICQGAFWRDYFNGLLGPNVSDKLLVIPNWIDYQTYQKTGTRRIISNTKEVNILFMGWMQVEKGVNDLFDALLKIHVNDYNVNVYFLGDGNEKEILIERANKENKKTNLHFYFPGWVHGNEKFEYLRKADIFVLPSYAEGMPNSLMEAMASKVAAISSNVGAVPDLIDDEVNGLLFKPKDTKALSIAIQRLIINKEERDIFASRAAEKIFTNHSLESVVPTFKGIL
jgi:glycosyltransferase involved in cell wall biosynthesis